MGNALDEYLGNDEVVSMHNENEKSGSTDCDTVNSTCSSNPQSTNQSNSGSVDCDMINKDMVPGQSMTFTPSCDHMLLILR